ncbi:hypothetical protein B0H13DRAFT_2253842 [Mycena leptocephala]|nr:hypothetical protein B0H13DRAFT_2253842 [Mycena leptocephala]
MASTRSSPVHPASLVDPSTHSPELMQLLDIHFSPPVIDYVVACVADTVDYAFGQPSAPPSQLPSFTRFVATTLSYADVASPTLLVALVYIARARPHLSIALAQWARERVFLGALIVASKYTQDSTLKNAHWSLVSGVFGTGDIGRIEREFLEVLDWELGVREGDVLVFHEGLVAAASGSTVSAKAAKSRFVLPAKDAHPHAPVPELQPSSPQSSAGSLSPRTPPSLSHSPFHSPSYSLSRSPLPTFAPATRTPPAKKPSHGRRRLYDLLRRGMHSSQDGHYLHPAIAVAVA